MKNLFAKVATTAITTAAVSAIALGVNFPVQAVSFIPFSFQTNFTTSGLFDPSKDVRLDSVVIDGNTVSQFAFVNRAEIIQNNGGTLASAHGLNTPQDPLIREGPSTPNPTGADLAASLGNPNLNSLVNTNEDPGNAIVDIFFAQPQSTFLIWERGGAPGTNIGGNSGLQVDALSDDGLTVLASYQIPNNGWAYAGYSLQSTIVPNSPVQNVGSLGLLLEGTQTRRLRFSSTNPSDFGPDYKVVAVAVPEPSMILGSLAIGGLLATFKRKRVSR